MVDHFQGAIPSLSNEVYPDSNGAAWKGRGIQPEWGMSALPDSNQTEGQWTAIQKLLGRI
ncbi:hypothetical protein NBRC116596_31420 [Litorivita sp. NS0012-18]